MTTRNFDNPRLGRAMLDGSLTIQSKYIGNDDYIITDDDPALLYWDPSANNKTLRLPDEATSIDRVYYLSNIDGSNGGIVNASNGTTAVITASVFGAGVFAIVHNDRGTWRRLIAKT